MIKSSSLCGLHLSQQRANLHKMEFDSLPGIGEVHLKLLALFVLSAIIHLAFHMMPIQESLDVP